MSSPSQNLLYIIVVSVLFTVIAACSNGQCRLLDGCSTDGDCEAELYCFSCPEGFSGSRCVRSTITDQFKLSNNSLPLNKYAFLTTHNSFAIDDGKPRLTFTNQEDSVTQQLNNGVRALMLDTYDFQGDVWLCHSFGGKCHEYTAFEPAIDTMKEIEAFMSANPSEIVTLILEDYVSAPNGLTKVFTDAGLMKYWFPLQNMPRNGGDWPLVSDMVANNQRLLVFTSIKSKEETEGIAYQWNYMVENQYGNGGMHAGSCPNRAESSGLDDKSKSLVLVNYFESVPVKQTTCEHNSADLINMLHTCYAAAGNRWANFVAVDYYKKNKEILTLRVCDAKRLRARGRRWLRGRGCLVLSWEECVNRERKTRNIKEKWFVVVQRSEGGGSFQAVDTLNGKLLCGCDDVHVCAPGSTSGACTS